MGLNPGKPLLSLGPGPMKRRALFTVAIIVASLLATALALFARSDFLQANHEAPDADGTVDFALLGTPDRVIDTTEVGVLLGFVGLAPASPGYSARLDLAADAGAVIDTTEASLILGFVGLSCAPP